jgi:predicted NBD/HSP70 family sugar kinase
MYIVADIGGTKTRIAGSRDLETFSDPVILDTPQSYSDGLAALVAAAQKITGGEPIEAIAAGVKGVLSEDKTTPLTAPQNILRDWREKPLAHDLESSLGARVVRLENDTALVGLGEAVHGAGRGASIVAYITVSTGVNGARIVEGAIDRGRAEIGGQYLQVGDAPKSLEDLISGAAISEKYGVHPKQIDKDSPVWEELARIAAFGVHNTILHWSPDRVVLGGSMFNEIGIPVPRVSFHVESIMHKFPHIPEIVHSSLADIGGLWGGLALLKQLVK